MSKVLIIDDENDICYLISEILNDESFTCKSANNSSQALELFYKFNPDLVILDVWLGSASDLDGIELCEVNVDKGQAKITFDNSKITENKILEALHNKTKHNKYNDNSHKLMIL